MDAKLDRVVAYDMVPTLRNDTTLSKKLFRFVTFFHLRIVLLIVQRATITLLL